MANIIENTTRHLKVFDKGRRMRGLWMRIIDGKPLYYAQIQLPGQSPRRFALHGATTVKQAEQKRQALKQQHKDGTYVPTQTKQALIARPEGGTAIFNEYASSYLAELKSNKLKFRKGKWRLVRDGTIEREGSCVANLIAHFGSQKIASITPADVMAYALKRRKEKLSGRAVDIDMLTLNYLFQKAIRDNVISGPAPTSQYAKQAEPPKKVKAAERAELDRLKAAATKDGDPRWPRSGQQFADYLELLACSGGRYQETIRLSWKLNVDFKNKRLGFGQDGLSKKGGGTDKPGDRWVDFNPALEAHLLAMKERAGESDWLFPSRFNDKVHLKSYRRNLLKVLKMTGVEHIGFHHLRHYLASHALMGKGKEGGVDLVTVAQWLGHKDNGVLLAKTYAHLNSAHRKEMAQKVTGL